MNNSQSKPKLTLTGVLVEDTESKGFTAWFEEFPEAVAEGETEDEVKINLFQSLITILEMRKEELTNDLGHYDRYKKTSFDFELAH